jgi:hypothetical protein
MLSARLRKSQRLVNKAAAGEYTSHKEEDDGMVDRATW